MNRNNLEPQLSGQGRQKPSHVHRTRQNCNRAFWELLATRSEAPIFHRRGEKSRQGSAVAAPLRTGATERQGIDCEAQRQGRADRCIPCRPNLALYSRHATSRRYRQPCREGGDPVRFGLRCRSSRGACGLARRLSLFFPAGLKDEARGQGAFQKKLGFFPTLPGSLEICL